MKLLCTALIILLGIGTATELALAGSPPRTVGVLFVVHGGSDDQDVADTFDTTLQFFQYDPNNIIFKGLIWNAAAWPTVVKPGDSQSYANAATQLKKYAFASSAWRARIPAPELTDRQFADLQKALKAEGRRQNVHFVADIAQWIGTQEQANRLPWPRYLYEPKVPEGHPADLLRQRDGRRSLAGLRSRALQRGRPGRAPAQAGRRRDRDGRHDGRRHALLEDLRRGQHDPPGGRRLEPAEWHGRARCAGSTTRPT